MRRPRLDSVDCIIRDVFAVVALILMGASWVAWEISPLLACLVGFGGLFAAACAFLAEVDGRRAARYREGRGENTDGRWDE